METNSQKNRQILVVDDDPSVGNMVARVLASEGYLPIVCAHPADALEASDRERFSLAFVDINLPGMSGLELASRLKERDPHREVIFITGHGSFDNAVQAIKIGAYDYLAKPFSINELNLCLRRYQERRELKEKIRRAENRYRSLVQNLPLLVYVIRKDLTLEFISQASLPILGYEPRDAIDSPLWLFQRVHPDDREMMLKTFISSFRRAGAPFSVESRLVHKSGHIINTIIKSIPASFAASGSEAESQEGIIVDITDRVSLERALVQREKLKTLGLVAAEVAHEIRNPLVSVGGFARRLKRRFPDLPECDIILRECRFLEKLLDRIRDYLKPSQIRRRDCLVNEIINEISELLSPEMERGRITLKLYLDDTIPAVFVDPGILSQVFINLMRNAMEAMGMGGTIYITSFDSDGHIHIDFKNEGSLTGVKDPELLFIPFDEGGYSIGLPLCYRLVKNLGGILSVAQEHNSTVFTVSFPKGVGRDLPPFPEEYWEMIDDDAVL